MNEFFIAQAAGRKKAAAGYITQKWFTKQAESGRILHSMHGALLERRDVHTRSNEDQQAKGARCLHIKALNFPL